MSRAEQLERMLAEAKALLRSEGLMPLPEGDREELAARLESLESRLKNLEDRILFIGLLGGTGVGKSSLMNALAGAPIASVSHRRPHTDRVLLYRHEACQPPRRIREAKVPIGEVTHREDAVRHLVMCDLPDFDSLVGEHRERVRDFLEHLDLVLWVTTPEKYADKRFYDFLREVPKAKENYAFVLNKADTFFAGLEPGEGHENLERVFRSFRDLVRQATGDGDPVVYAVSAREVQDGADPSSWNQFPFLKKSVFQQREAKEIRAIKESNLDAEAESVLEWLLKGVEELRRLHRVVTDLEKELAGLRETWRRSCRTLWRSWISPRVVESVAGTLENPEDLTGPAALVAWVARRVGGYGGSPQPGGGPDVEELLRRAEDRCREQWRWIGDHLLNRIAGAGLAGALRAECSQWVNRLSSGEDCARAVARLREGFPPEGPPVRARAFRFKQKAVTLLWTVFLLFALGGEAAWRTFLQDPGPAAGLGVVVAVVNALFSPRGLAALGSYAVLQLLSGLRFHKGYRKFLRARAQRIIDSLQRTLEEAWESQWRLVEAAIDGWRKDVEKRLARVESLLAETRSVR
ncbi:50S ribosome-binding GTPase [Desulfacinum infernum DSM 9756]|uniref:50S ribosome-binding GTPase n=1 Tax=Desulfacinum infernum DSM 9756 TaxID=1121391 RepID=A0A1M5IUV0_9BACT|nr:GTPase [Desulfacinum infernum]SHG32097.1 50S ribosome-binding GTPase [Desulfacinum infernum DSM 9756]